MPEGTANKVIPGCGTHHVAIQSRDWDASLQLYRDVLGMKPVAEFGPEDRRILLLDAGDGSHIELFQPTGETPSPGGPSPNDPVTHIALATTDARTATETRPVLWIRSDDRTQGCQPGGTGSNRRVLQRPERRGDRVLPGALTHRRNRCDSTETAHPGRERESARP